MSEALLDLRAVTERLNERRGATTQPNEHWEADDDCAALLAHCRALRAALRAVIPSEVARKVMAEYGDAGSLLNDVVTSYEHAAAVLASVSDGEAAP